MAARSDPAAFVLYDSDDDHHPNREPEFIVHIMDDDDDNNHNRPPPPPPQPAPPAAPPSRQRMIQQPPPSPPVKAGRPMLKTCSLFFVGRVFHSVEVMFLAVVIVVTVARQPKETKHPSALLLQILASVIAVLAFTWISCADLAEGD